MFFCDLRNLDIFGPVMGFTFFFKVLDVFENGCGWFWMVFGFEHFSRWTVFFVIIQYQTTSDMMRHPFGSGLSFQESSPVYSRKLTVPQLISTIIPSQPPCFVTSLFLLLNTNFQGVETDIAVSQISDFSLQFHTKDELDVPLQGSRDPEGFATSNPILVQSVQSRCFIDTIYYYIYTYSIIYIYMYKFVIIVIVIIVIINIYMYKYCQIRMFDYFEFQ